MKEASVVKYYFTKYFFLAFGMMQVLIGGLIFIRQGENSKGQFASYLFFTLGLIFTTLYITVTSKVRRVAIGKKKVVVMGRYKNQRYDLDDIKSIKLLPAFHIYAMKIKGKKNKVYFLASENTEAIYGLFSAEPELALKKVKS